MASVTSISKKEIVEALRDNPEELFEEADSVRKKYCGDEVHVRGIIEFSNHCCRSCLYCGLRCQNRAIHRYRIPADEIVQIAGEISRCGAGTVVLQSGDDFGFGHKELSNVIVRIKKDNPSVAITLCLGERPLDDYKAFKDAGADRYLLKHETANPELYEKLHPGQTLRTRIKILEYLRKSGYQIGAGNIVGLPGQTIEDIASDILLLKELDVYMAGIGPFIPQKETPLKDYASGTLELTLKTLALVRIYTKNTHLPATTALATLSPENGQLLALRGGCNVLMPDWTPERYRKDYIIYDGKVRVDVEKAKELISKAGRTISRGRGDSFKERNEKAESVL